MQKFSKKSSLVLTLCILSAISSSGYAAEKDSLHQYNLDEYVVTATRTALTQKEVPQSVEVITKADIQNVGAISVRDVLKTATNLHIDDGGGGHGDQFTIRGSVTNDILILVNGRRIAGENIYPNGSSNTRILDRLNLSKSNVLKSYAARAVLYTAVMPKEALSTSLPKNPKSLNLSLG